MDTLKKEQQEAHGRLKVLYEDKERLTVSYKDKKRKVDESKEQLQSKISDYSSLSEKGGVCVMYINTCIHPYVGHSVY